MVGGVINLHHVGLALTDQPYRSPERGRNTLLDRAEWKIAVHHRPLSPARHGLARENHLIQRHLVGCRLSPIVASDAVTNREHIGASAVQNLRHLVVVADDCDDPLPVGLHLLKPSDGQLRHPIASFPFCPFLLPASRGTHHSHRLHGAAIPRRAMEKQVASERVSATAHSTADSPYPFLTKAATSASDLRSSVSSEMACSSSKT